MPLVVLARIFSRVPCTHYFRSIADEMRDTEMLSYAVRPAFGVHSSGTVPFPSREHRARVRHGLGDAQLGLGALSEFDVDFLAWMSFAGTLARLDDVAAW